MKRYLRYFTPARTIPQSPWTARHSWDLSFKRLFILFLGLTLLGIGGAMVVRSGLGNAPWTVFAQGVSMRTGITIGTAFFLSSVIVLLMWIPLSIKPGFGTFANAIFFAFALDWAISMIPTPSKLTLSLLMLLVGIVLVGAGSAIYMTCGLGGGPRDGLLMGLIKRTGIRIAYLRTSMEGSVLTVGFILGGRVGIGTILSIFLASWSVAIWFNLVGQLPRDEGKDLSPAL